MTKIQFESSALSEESLDELICKKIPNRPQEKTTQKPNCSSKRIPELDLHDCVAHEAKAKIDHFIRSIHAQSYKRARVITGKGNHSKDNKSVLKEVFLEWVEEQDGLIKGIKKAPVKNGGSGAFIIALN